MRTFIQAVNYLAVDLEKQGCHAHKHLLWTLDKRGGTTFRRRSRVQKAFYDIAIESRTGKDLGAYLLSAQLNESFIDAWRCEDAAISLLGTVRSMFVGYVRDLRVASRVLADDEAKSILSTTLTLWQGYSSFIGDMRVWDEFLAIFVDMMLMGIVVKPADCKEVRAILEDPRLGRKHLLRAHPDYFGLLAQHQLRRESISGGRVNADEFQVDVDRLNLLYEAMMRQAVRVAAREGKTAMLFDAMGAHCSDS